MENLTNCIEYSVFLFRFFRKNRMLQDTFPEYIKKLSSVPSKTAISNIPARGPIIYYLSVIDPFVVFYMTFVSFTSISSFEAVGLCECMRK